jgi:rhamnosyltransferase subunit B
LLTRGGGGDLLPFLRIGTLLKTLGHEVVLFSHCVFEPTVTQAGLDFVALDEPDEVERMLTELPLLNTPRGLVEAYRQTILARLPREYELMRERWEPGNTLLISHHNSQITAQITRERLGGPLALIFTAPNFLINMVMAEQLYQLLGDEINALRATLDLPAVHNWRDWWRSAERVVGLWPEWFAPPEANWPARPSLAGFLLSDQQPDVALPAPAQAILDSGEAPILITHGTSLPTDPAFFTASAEACRKLGRRGILVTLYEHLVPDPLPEQVAWVKYFPFEKLIPRMGAVVHHGGIGTAAQCLAAAVPQLVLAFGFDRPDNAQRLQQLGVAEALPPPQWRSDTIAAALERLTGSDAVWERCQELARRMRESDPVNSVCRAIEELVADRALFENAPTNPGQSVALDEAPKSARQQSLLEQLSPQQRKLLALRLRERSATAPGVDK